mgnify:CR=1 FL=1
MKWKRYQLIGMGAGALVFATVAGVSFLLGTSAGLRVLSSGAEWAVDGLKVGDVSGSLLHLRLSDVRYEAPGIRFKADRFSYDVAGRAVFSNRIVVDDVRLAGAEIVVRTKELPRRLKSPPRRRRNCARLCPFSCKISPLRTFHSTRTECSSRSTTFMYRDGGSSAA